MEKSFGASLDFIANINIICDPKTYVSARHCVLTDTSYNRAKKMNSFTYSCLFQHYWKFVKWLQLLNDQ